MAFPGASTAAVQPRGMMIRAMAMCHLLYVNRCAAAWKEEDEEGRVGYIYLFRISRDATHILRVNERQKAL